MSLTFEALLKIGHVLAPPESDQFITFCDFRD